jgi:hypothetical protein
MNTPRGGGEYADTQKKQKTKYFEAKISPTERAWWLLLPK